MSRRPSGYYVEALQAAMDKMAALGIKTAKPDQGRLSALSYRIASALAKTDAADSGA